MSDKPFSLIPLEAISEPVVKLIDTVSNAVGAIFEPTQIVRIARADAEKLLIATESQIEAQEMMLRAQIRLDALELRRQKNIETIIKEAAAQLPEKVSTETVDQDWVIQFFNYSQDVGNEEMQLIWARLLAGEVEKPGSFSLRTLQLVRVLRQSDAVLFKRFCNLVWDGRVHFYSHSTHAMLETLGLGYGELLQLESLGLISLNLVDWMPQRSEITELSYLGQTYNLIWDRESLPSGVKIYPLTDIGQELAPICDIQPNQEYLQGVLTEFRERGYKVSQVED